MIKSTMGKNKEILWENDGDIGVLIIDVTDKENFLRHFYQDPTEFQEWAMEKHEKRRIPDVRQNLWDPRAQQEGKCARVKRILVREGKKGLWGWRSHLEPGYVRPW